MHAVGVQDDAPDLIASRLAAFGELLYGFLANIMPNSL